MNIVEDINRYVKTNRRVCREDFTYFFCTNSLNTFGIVCSRVLWQMGFTSLHSLFTFIISS